MTTYLKLGEKEIPFKDERTGLEVNPDRVVEVNLNMTSPGIEQALLSGQLVYASVDDYLNYKMTTEQTSPMLYDDLTIRYPYTYSEYMLNPNPTEGVVIEPPKYYEGSAFSKGFSNGFK